MPPLKINYHDSDPTTILLREWMQPLINKYISRKTTIRPPTRGIITERKQVQWHKNGIYNYVRVWDFLKIDKYEIYGVVRDSINLQLSCI